MNNSLIRLFTAASLLFFISGTAGAVSSNPLDLPEHLRLFVASGGQEIETPIGLSYYELTPGGTLSLSSGNQEPSASPSLVGADAALLSCIHSSVNGETVRRWTCTALASSNGSTMELYFETGGRRSNGIRVVVVSSAQPHISMVTTNDTNYDATVFFDRTIGSPMRLQYEILGDGQRIHAGGMPVTGGKSAIITGLLNIYKANSPTGAMNVRIRVALCNPSAQDLNIQDCGPVDEQTSISFRNNFSTADYGVYIDGVNRFAVQNKITFRAVSVNDSVLSRRGFRFDLDKIWEFVPDESDTQCRYSAESRNRHIFLKGSIECTPRQITTATSLSFTITLRLRDDWYCNTEEMHMELVSDRNMDGSPMNDTAMLTILCPLADARASVDKATAIAPGVRAYKIRVWNPGEAAISTAKFTIETPAFLRYRSNDVGLPCQTQRAGLILCTTSLLQPVEGTFQFDVREGENCLSTFPIQVRAIPEHPSSSYRYFEKDPSNDAASLDDTFVCAAGGTQNDDVAVTSGSLSSSAGRWFYTDYEKKQGTSSFLHMTIAGTSIEFSDVPVKAWFGYFVHELIRENILSGYTNANNVPLGKFGPEDPVTYAQVAKIAVNAGKFSVAGLPAPKNRSARNQWSAPYIAFMEQRGVSLFADGSIDVNQPAPRSSVLQLMYEVQGIKAEPATGTVYTDVTKGTKAAGFIEMATRDGIVSGDGGKKTFRPHDPINRAEAAKIVLNFMDRAMAAQSDS